jgi:preprotein translocase subunit SecE
MARRLGLGLAVLLASAAFTLIIWSADYLGQPTP